MSSKEVSWTTFKGSKSGEIIPVTYTQKPLTGDQVLISVTVSGVCGSDLHFRTENMALGHEGIGTVSAVGPEVRQLKLGDRVGWGYVHTTCGRCRQCLQGTEQYCPERKMYGTDDLEQGSFAHGAVWREPFTYKIPDALSDEDAAPLMCGGATVFNALQLYGVRATDRVGVLGVGGLGHLAIQFASKMGCNTVVFSGTDSKKEEALKLGAHEFFATKGADKLDIGRPVDVLLVTTSAMPDWKFYLPVLAPQATIFPISVDMGDFKFPNMALLEHGIRIQGTMDASRQIHKDMLEFAALHGIKPMVNRFALDKDGIEEAMKTLEAGSVKAAIPLVRKRAAVEYLHEKKKNSETSYDLKARAHKFMGKHEGAPATVVSTPDSDNTDMTEVRKKRKTLASPALQSHEDGNGTNHKSSKKQKESHRSLNGRGDRNRNDAQITNSITKDQDTEEKPARKKRRKDSERKRNKPSSQVGEDLEHSTEIDVKDAAILEVREPQSQQLEERAGDEDRLDLVNGSHKEHDGKEAFSSNVAEQIGSIQEINDIDSPLLIPVDGEHKKISKAKRKRVKVLKKAKDKNQGELVSKAKSLDIQSIDNPKKPSHEPDKDASSISYVESTDLAAVSQSQIDTYLTSNAISIEEAPHTKSLRPILDFKYLPAGTLEDRSIFKNFETPTPIQAATWPYLLSGQDVVGVAETGSGKTLAFGVPCIRRLSNTTSRAIKPKSPVRAVIVSPTRELAMQIHQQFLPLASPHNLNPVCVYGGVSKEPQRLALPTSHIIIATPGRLIDLIDEGSADLSGVDYLVLDEADRMLDTGFEDSIRRIISACSPHPTRQTCMFTATWPPSVRSLAESFMRSPVKIRIGDNLTGELRANARIEQRVEVLDTNPRTKESRLLQLVRQFQKQGSASDRILVFALYKKEAVRVEAFLRSKGFKVGGIHGDLSQDRRTTALDAFKRGTTPILVATDVAARGLDIPAVKVVINVTFPLTVEDYVHRIGRTGRAGAEGLAVTLFTEHDKGNSGALINVLRGAKQVVPEELVKFGTTVKKREHDGYGAFYREDSGKKATKIRFD